MGATGLIVGLIGAGKAGKGSGQLRDFSDELNGMPTGDYYSQLQDLMDRQMGSDQNFAGQDLSLYPQFQGAAEQGQLRTGQAALSLYPEAAGLEQQMTGQQRANDSRNLSVLGPGYASALGAASPGYAALNGVINNASAGPSPLLGQLNQEAMMQHPGALERASTGSALDQLGLGSSLSAEQTRDATQAARAGFADRGLAMSNPAVAAEVLGRDQYGQQLLQQRQAYANNVWGMQTGAQGQRNQFQTGVQGLNTSDQASRAQQVMSAEGAQMSPILSWANSRTDVSPWGASNAMSLAPSVGMPGQVMQGAPQIGQASQALQPLYNYGQNVYDWNANAQETRAFNEANAYTSLGAGLISAGAQVSGSGGGGSPSSSPTGGPAPGALSPTD